jgi:hypothetical protein
LIFSRPTWYVVDGHDLPTASVLIAMAGNLPVRVETGQPASHRRLSISD